MLLSFFLVVQDGRFGLLDILDLSALRSNEFIHVF